MNWKVKFAQEDVLTNQPWVLVEDSLETAPSDTFLEKQKRLILTKGWDWFKKAVRGRFFPNLKVTTVTTWDGERKIDNDESIPVAKIQQMFPGVSIVSLLGGAHVLAGHVDPQVLNQIGKIAQNKTWKDGLSKFADRKSYYQDKFEFEIADVDRYQTDKYIASLTLQETHQGYSIGFQMYNSQIGLTGHVAYWHYDKDEFSRAKKTFRTIKTALIDTVRDIDYFRPPMALNAPMVRAVLQPIDVAKREKTNINACDWNMQLPSEADWRQTLYGNRYPVGRINTLDVNWNEDDQGKEITTVGTSRSRIFLYKPSVLPNTKIAANMEQLKRLLSDAWGISSAGVAGGVLAWLINLGIPLPVIEQKIQQGASPQQIMQEIQQESQPEATSPAPPTSPTLPAKESTPVQEKVLPDAAKTQEKPPDSPSVSKQPSSDSKHLQGLKPEFASKVQQVLSILQKKGWKPRIAESIRNIQEQQKKIDQGFSFLKNPNNSKHVHGLAVDIIDERYGWQGKAASQSFQFWSDLGEAAQSVGLKWGGEWKTKDVAHIEWK